MKSKVVLAVFLAVAVLLCSSALAQAKEYTYKPTPDKFYYLFGGGEPVLKVEPGIESNSGPRMHSKGRSGPKTMCSPRR